MHPLTQQFLEIVEDQLAKGKPAFVGNTLQRLQQEGFAAKDAKDLIACCLAHEMGQMLEHNRLFSDEYYQKTLEQLPDLP